MAGLVRDTQGFPVVTSDFGQMEEIGEPTFNVIGSTRVAPGQHFFLRRAIAPVFAAIRAHLAEDTSLVLHISSAMPGEGVSTVARELAFIAGQASWCNTLLLDGNPSGSGQAAYFGQSVLPDMGRSMRGSGGRMDAIQVLSGASVFHMAALPMSGDEAISVSEPGFLRQCYSRLKETFRLIIIDCPPIMTSPDTTALSGYSDGVVLVIEAEKTRVPVVVRCREEIENADGVVRGIVMNKRRQYIPSVIYKLL
ncbi:MAG: CpsD/CapB family tyrosine-protein kinase [Magnetospirillum sp.]|nr:CpsD/CapB family tyrosine-protein kinase [Magnetospirillum sp.]